MMSSIKLAKFGPQQELEAFSKQNKSQIVDFYQNRSVLITGGSGFIGKVLIEKLLRTCPGIRNIYVLIRPKWKKQPKERLEELLAAPLFDTIRQVVELEKRVIVVEGDVTQANLGLSEQNLLKIMNDVSVIYHSAATVKFDEPLKQSVAINITGTKNMIELCRKIPQLAALVHVSTAYANCQLDEIDEHVYPVEMNPENMIEIANWLDQDTLQELKTGLLGKRPNTYTYTKALAEWLLIKCARDLPVVICRPSIVTASWREPFAGWIDNVNGPTGIILGAGKGLVRSMFGEPNCVADLVPVDTVINLVVALGWFAHVYRNHKQQVSDLAESLSESLLGSSSLSDVEDDTSFDGSGFPERINEHYNTSDSIKHPSRGDTNNNNNNNSGNDQNKMQQLKQELQTRDLYNDENVNDNGNNNLTTTLLSNHHPHNNHQLDDGYGSAPYSYETKSTASSSSSSFIRDSSANNLINISSDRADVISNQVAEQTGAVMSYVSQRRLAEQKHAAFEYKLKQFRHNTQQKLSAKNLPEEIADIPVFHCTSGQEKPITWGTLELLVITLLRLYPISASIFRYPSGKFTNNKLKDNFYRFTLHYLPGYLVDLITRLKGGKPSVVKIFNKFDQAASVLEAFTRKEWKFNHDNRLMLINELMSDEDRHLFNFDISELVWLDFFKGYVLGVRKYMLKESIEDLDRARSNLRFTYWKNMSLQVVSLAVFLYFIIPTSFTRNLVSWGN